MHEAHYHIRVKLPDDIDKEYFREYMRAAIEEWSGQFHPEHSLFGWFHNKQRLWIQWRKKR